MPLTINATPDINNLTLTVVTELSASRERVWQLWADPRQLERWWGPPEYPATFTQHELVAGTRTSYHMTGPDGEKMPGWWIIVAVDEPNSITLNDGFATDTGEPDPAMPIAGMTVTLKEITSGTRMTIISRFENVEGMQQMLDMGMEEGMTAAMGQIEDVLASS
jgi:uncharacterized protein YndB with AHSA1/START domain